jgi:uncharacterized delta-60 repeat protein
MQSCGRDFAVARYNPDGTLDTTFDGDGRVISINTPNFDGAVDVSIQADDRIVVLGYVSLAAVPNFAVVRYNTDGSLDTTFGGTGIVTTSFGGTSNQPSAVVVQPDGKVLGVGTVFPPGNRNFALVRFNADGSPDASFGVGGHVTTNFNPADRLNEVALQADGKIVVAGQIALAPGPGVTDFAVVRYEP